VEERGLTDGSYVFFQWEVTIIDYAKVSCSSGWSEGGAMKLYGAWSDFGALLGCANKEVLSFRRIDSETVCKEPRMDRVKYWWKYDKVFGRVRGRERYVELCVIGIKMVGDRRVGKYLADGRSVKGEQKWAQNGSLRDSG
jgi:hypothetical protein